MTRANTSNAPNTTAVRITAGRDSPAVNGVANRSSRPKARVARAWSTTPHTTPPTMPIRAV